MPAYRYTGNGEHYETIPARDLSEEEYAALSDAQRALVGNGRIYAVVVPPAPEKPGKKADAAPAEAVKA